MATSNLQYHFKAQSFDVRKIFIEFNKPFYSNLFYKNKDGLVLTADRVKFNMDKWYCNPLLFCEDYYSIQYLYPVILLCNSLGTVYDFTQSNLKDGIISPSLSEINRVLSYAKEPVS
jgi:hypothetical protein